MDDDNGSITMPCSCGATEDELGIYEDVDETSNDFVLVECLACGARGPKVYCQDKPAIRKWDYAVTLWNKERAMECAAIGDLKDGGH